MILTMGMTMIKMETYATKKSASKTEVFKMRAFVGSTAGRGPVLSQMQVGMVGPPEAEIAAAFLNQSPDVRIREDRSRGTKPDLDRGADHLGLFCERILTWRI